MAPAPNQAQAEQNGPNNITPIVPGINTDIRITLSLRDRLTLRNLLPGQGSRLLMQDVNRLVERLEFSEAEKLAWEITETPLPDGGFNYIWNTKIGTDTEIAIPTRMHVWIGDRLRKLDQEGEDHPNDPTKGLSALQARLWDKFIPSSSASAQPPEAEAQ